MKPAVALAKEPERAKNSSAREIGGHKQVNWKNDKRTDPNKSAQIRNAKPVALYAKKVQTSIPALDQPRS
jgi:hypothetical protein